MKQVFNTTGDVLVPSTYLSTEHSKKHVLIVHG